MKITPKWKQPNVPFCDWINKSWYMHTMEYYLAMKRSELCRKTKMSLKSIILSQRSQNHKRIHTEWVYSYRTVTKRELIYNDRKQISGYQGMGRAGEELDYKETWGRLGEGVMDMLLIWTVVIFFFLMSVNICQNSSIFTGYCMSTASQKISRDRLPRRYSSKK